MPLEPETGIYRAPSKKVLSPRAVAAKPSKGKIAKWPREKRNAFEREILAMQKPLKQIAEEHGIAYGTAIQWKVKTLGPAVRAAQQQHDIQEQSAAREHLSYLYGVSRRATDALENGKIEVNPETGEETRVPVDPRVYGTLAQHIGQGVNLAKTLGEFTGEIAEVAAASGRPTENTIIRVISMPKQTGVEISMSNRLPRPIVELSPVPDDNENPA